MKGRKVSVQCAEAGRAVYCCVIVQELSACFGCHQISQSFIQKDPTTIQFSQCWYDWPGGGRSV